MDSNEKKELPSEEESTKSLNTNAQFYKEPNKHLESLGFSLVNGKARFKLNEDEPGTLPDCKDDSDDTLSFVVLGNDSLDYIQQSSLASYVDIQQKCMSVNYNSMIASWDSAEVHKKLNELLQENAKLKETLRQNTLAMKQQFNTLVNWQEEIMKVQQNHKKKFSETRELVNYLKKENAELKLKIGTDLNSHTEMGYELINKNDEQDTTEKEEESIPANDSLFIHIKTILKNEITESEKANTNSKQFLEEKQVLDNLKKNLDMEYKQLNDAKECLEQERVALQQEQICLDKKNAEIEEKLRTEKETFEEIRSKLGKELSILHETLEKRDLYIKDIEKELAQHKDNASVLQTEIMIYKEDYKQLTEGKDSLLQSLLEEKSALSVDLQKQIEFNEQLQKEIIRLNGSTNTSITSLAPPLVSSLVCPKCDSTFSNMHSLETHVDQCLDLV